MELAFVFFAIAAVAGIYEFLRHIWPRKPALHAASTFAVRLEPAQAGAVMAQYLAGRGFERLQTVTVADVHIRGDGSITHVPWDRAVGWSEIPVMLGVRFQPFNDRTVVAINVRSRLGVKFSGDALRFFTDKCRIELERAEHLLNCAAEHEARARDERFYGGGPQARSRQADCSDGTGRDASEGIADYAVLGLKPGASWVEVQAAYREACMKFHPDHLSGQNVAPHLVELAVQRFQEVTTAYRRLKERQVSSSGAR